MRFDAEVWGKVFRAGKTAVGRMKCRTKLIVEEGSTRTCLHKNRSSTANSAGNEVVLEEGKERRSQSRIFNARMEQERRMRKFEVPVYIYSR